MDPLAYLPVYLRMDVCIDVSMSSFGVPFVNVVNAMHNQAPGVIQERCSVVERVVLGVTAREARDVTWPRLFTQRTSRVYYDDHPSVWNTDPLTSPASFNVIRGFSSGLRG